MMCVGLSFRGLDVGNVDEMYAPIDGDNNLCGIGDLADFPYLYIFDLDTALSNNLFLYSVCVDTCPTYENAGEWNYYATNESSTYPDGAYTSNPDGDDTVVLSDLLTYCIPNNANGDTVVSNLVDMLNDSGFSSIIDLKIAT
jgi:hypothetical protein